MVLLTGRNQPEIRKRSRIGCKSSKIFCKSEGIQLTVVDCPSSEMNTSEGWKSLRNGCEHRKQSV